MSNKKMKQVQDADFVDDMLSNSGQTGEWVDLESVFLKSLQRASEEHPLRVALMAAELPGTIDLEGLRVAREHVTEKAKEASLAVEDAEIMLSVMTLALITNFYGRFAWIASTDTDLGGIDEQGDVVSNAFLLGEEYRDTDKYDLLGMVVIAADNPLVYSINTLLNIQRYTSEAVARAWDVDGFITAYRAQGHNINGVEKTIFEPNDDGEPELAFTVIYILHDKSSEDGLVRSDDAILWAEISRDARHYETLYRMRNSHNDSGVNQKKTDDPIH